MINFDEKDIELLEVNIDLKDNAIKFFYVMIITIIFLLLLVCVVMFL